MERERIQAHFASTPKLIRVPGHAGVEAYSHAACADDCADLLRSHPDFDCFDDGCQMECCGCGRCCDPARCADTGKGYSWHS